MGVAPTKLAPVTPKSLEVPDLEARLKVISEHVEKTVEDTKLIRFSGPIEAVPIISSGSLALDIALGIGGYQQGRVVEVYGPESSGKTTLTLHAIASAQKSGGIAAFIDAEHALDLKYANNLHVDIDHLLLCQPDFGEQALNVVDALVDNMKWGDIIVVDSVAALTPKAEIEGDVGDQQIGLQARMMSKALRMLVGKVSKSGVVLYFTNQIRDSINIGGYGPATDTGGGRALKFYAAQRINTKKEGHIEAPDPKNPKGPALKIANKVSVYIAKNKTAPPFRTAHTVIRFGEGVSRLDELIDFGKRYNTFKVSGAWIHGPPYDGKPKPTDAKELEKWWVLYGQGDEQVRQYLIANPKIADAVEKEIREGLGF